MAEEKETGYSITIRSNGPYLARGKIPLRKGGETLETKAVFALCRCGLSANKPFCDGTHSKQGFSGEETASQSAPNRVDYRGDGITIHDDRALCAHAGVCTDRLPSVWKMGGEPWIDPAGASLNETIAIVEQCPSGALTYSLDDGGVESSGDAAIEALPNGPLAVSGQVPVSSAEGESYLPRNRMTLCRCGASKNKPFCDGSHYAAGFSD